MSIEGALLLPDPSSGRVEGGATRKADSRQRRPRSARFQTIASDRKTGPRERVRQFAAAAGTDQNERQQSRIPLTPNPCESMQAEFARRLDSRSEQPSVQFLLTRSFSCPPLRVS